MKYVLKNAPKVDAVQVKETECNIALWPSPDTFEDAPFSEPVSWIIDLIDAGRLRPHTSGGTDYAQWTLSTMDKWKNARPGDWIVRSGPFDDGYDYAVWSNEDFARSYDAISSPAQEKTNKVKGIAIHDSGDVGQTDGTSSDESTGC